MIEQMYQQQILDHFRNPHNFGSLDSPTTKARDVNPLCGDVIEVHLSIDEKILKDVKFSGSGCAISLASASMLTDSIKGKTINEIAKLNKDDVLELMQIDISPMRLKCALLCLKVLKLALYEYMGEKHDNQRNNYC